MVKGKSTAYLRCVDCRACGTANSERSKFCKACATRFPRPAARPAPAPRVDSGMSATGSGLTLLGLGAMAQIGAWLLAFVIAAYAAGVAGALGVLGLGVTLGVVQVFRALYAEIAENRRRIQDLERERVR